MHTHKNFSTPIALRRFLPYIILALMSLMEGQQKHSWPLIRGESCTLYASATEALCICVRHEG